jgi:hypothetical protein
MGEKQQSLSLSGTLQQVKGFFFKLSVPVSWDASKSGLSSLS